MKYALIFICCLLMASTVLNCKGIRTQATRTQQARLRRMEDATE